VDYEKLSSDCVGRQASPYLNIESSNINCNYSRAYHRILKFARTVADLAGSEDIQSVHLAEAR